MPRKIAPDELAMRLRSLEAQLVAAKAEIQALKAVRDSAWMLMRWGGLRRPHSQ